MSSGEKCDLCEVSWRPDSSDIWGPSITSLNKMPIKMESHAFKPFQEASVQYANKNMNRSPNYSLGNIEEQKFRTNSKPGAAETLQIIGNQFIHYCKQQEIASFVVADLVFHYSSYYKKILAKQSEMNDKHGDTQEYLHDPRLIVVTPTWGVIFVRVVTDNEQSSVKKNMRRAKILLDKDSILMWRLFQDIFKEKSVNFTGVLAFPNVSQDSSKSLVCKKCSDFTIFRHHLESHTAFSDWIKHHIKNKTPLKSNTFVDVVTRLNALYVLFETPQQNLDTDPDDDHEEKHHSLDERVVKHVAKVLMSPQQFEILTSTVRHRVLFGEYGSGKTQVLIEKVRQVAWEMHFKKITSVIYLFSFADVEESGKLSLNECLLSHFLMSINKRYSDVVSPNSQGSKSLFNSDLLPPEIHVKVVIASMRQLVRLKEGKTAKIKDIPGFLTQCITSKVRQSKDTLIHVFIDEIPFSAFLNDDNKKWNELISSVSQRSHVYLTSRLPLYLWFQDDRDDNSHVLTDFFLEELLRTNVTGSNMFYLPESFQVSFFSQVMRSQKPILVLMKEYYNLSQSAQVSYHAAKQTLARRNKSPSHQAKADAKAKLSGKDPVETPLWLPMPKCMCDENPALKKKSDNKYCGCFVPRLAFIIDYMLSLLQINTDRSNGTPREGAPRLSDLLICCDTNSLHLLKRLGQALHIVDIDFIIYESDTWSNPHYAGESSGPQDRLEASGSALGHVDKVLVTTCLGSRGLEKKIVVYISPENMGDFLAIVKEKNFIEVVSRSISQVVIITVDDPKEGSLNPESLIDSIEVILEIGSKKDSRFKDIFQSVESLAWPQPLPGRDNLDISGALAGADSFSFVGLLKRLKHRGLLRETKLPLDQYIPATGSSKTQVKSK